MLSASRRQPHLLHEARSNLYTVQQTFFLQHSVVVVVKVYCLGMCQLSMCHVTAGRCYARRTCVVHGRNIHTRSSTYHRQ